MSVMLGTDGFRYRVVDDWAKLPPGYEFNADVAAVGVDKNDNVYAFSRGEHPMIVFDRDGNFVTGTQRVLSMKLRDETYQRLSHSGVTVRTSFDLKPGDYVVRLVVRDSNAAALSAENGVVQIPY